MHLHTTATVTMIVAVVVFKASHCNNIALRVKMTRIKQVAEATMKRIKRMKQCAEALDKKDLY